MDNQTDQTNPQSKLKTEKNFRVNPKFPIPFNAQFFPQGRYLSFKTQYDPHYLGSFLSTYCAK